MKRIALIVGIFVWSFCAISAQAKTLEDVLREKGVITEEDYREVTRSKPIDYKVGKGFTFTTADEKFRLTLGGRMQFRYTFTDFGNNSAKTDSSQWDAKRIRLIAQGYAYTKDLTYDLEFDPRAYASATYKGLVNAWMNYRLIDEIQIKVGQYKTPFSRQELTSDGALQFVDRSVTVDAFKPTYDIGAMLNGKIAGGLVDYYAGVFGGAGQTSTRSSNDNLFVARVTVNPFGDMPYSEADLGESAKPLLSIGADYFRNTVNKTGTTLDVTVPNYAGSGGWLGKGFKKAGFASANDKLNVDSYGADLAFKWMGLSVQGEYLLGQAEAQSNGHLLRAQGFYVQSGYMVIPKNLELAIRYSYLDPDRDVANDLISEQIGAISWYFDKHSLKIQGDVGNVHTQGNQTVGGVTRPTDDMQYRVQAQIIF
jgi:phosphate-selective porin OprO and OprP